MSDATPPSEPTSTPTPRADVSTVAALDVDPREIGRGLLAAAIGLAAGWLAALVGIFLVAFTENPFADGVLIFLTAPAQLVAMAFGGALRGSFDSGDVDFAISGDLTYRAVPITVLLVVLGVTWYAARRLAPRTVSSVRRHVTTSAVVGLGAALLLCLVALVLPVSLDEGLTSQRAGDVGQVVVTTLLVGLAVLAGRRAAVGPVLPTRVPAAARDAAWAAAVHVLTLTPLVAVVFVVWALVEGEPSAITVLPLGLGNLVVLGATLGHLGAVGGSGVFTAFGESSGGSDAGSLFSSDVPAGLWVLVPVVLLGLLAAACSLHVRGASRGRTHDEWGWTAGAFAVLGLVFTVTGYAGIGGTASFAGGSLGLGPAGWTFLLLAAWGVGVETARRRVAPGIVSALPARVTSLLRGPAARESAVPDVPAAEPVPMTPEQQRRVRIAAIVGGALVALLVVGAVGVSIVGKTVFSPKDEVSAYLDAVTSGRGVEEAIAATEDDELAGDAEVAAALLEGVGGDGEYTIRDVETSGDSATVTARVEVGGSTETQTFQLARTGSRLVLFPEWTIIDAPSASLGVSAAGAEALTSGDTEVALAGLDEGAEVAVVPASYSIGATSGSRFVEYSAQDVDVESGGFDSVSLELSATPELVQEATEQANDYLDACIAKTELDPDDCPNQSYGYEVSGVRWTLDEKPAFTLESSYDGTWSLRTETPGSATATGKEASIFGDEPASDYSDTVDISMNGSVEVDGDTVTVDFSDGYFF